MGTYLFIANSLTFGRTNPVFFVVAMRIYELTVLSCYGRAPVLRRKAAIPWARR